MKFDGDKNSGGARGEPRRDAVQNLLGFQQED